jgi:hypothetical protein
MSQTLPKRANKPSPAWRERVVSAASRVRVSAPDAPLATLAGAPTLTRLVPLATLSRQAGEGY